MANLTAAEALDLVGYTAQRCRENGDGDMRNILNVVRGIKHMMAEGKTGEEILAEYEPDEDEDED